jgi:hypothetical protein
VNCGARKALVLQVLLAFEPKRSNRPKQFHAKDLKLLRRNYNCKTPNKTNQRNSMAISTIGGDR